MPPANKVSDIGSGTDIGAGPATAAPAVIRQAAMATSETAIFLVHDNPLVKRRRQPRKNQTILVNTP